LRDAIKKWAVNRLGATGEFDVLPLIGSKEFVAWLPTFLQSRKVLFPKVAYPTYNVGAIIAGAEPLAVDLDAQSWPDSDLAWINSPSNPTGRVHTESELKAAISYSRTHNTPVVLEIRKHAGMMVPLPIQHAMIAALSDDTHVLAQRDRYNQRRKTLAPALESIGFRIEHSEAGLYIWCTRGQDSWKSVEALAQLGILVTPGIFYGTDGAQHVRIAMTATDKAIADAAARITASKAQ